MPEFPVEVRDLLARQDGVVTRSQLLEHGISDAAVRWNAGRAWRLLLPHVHLVSREQPTPRQRQIAALLWAGPRSVLSGPTAARIHGITAADPRDRVDVMVMAPQSTRHNGFAHVRRTYLHDDGVIIRGAIRLSSPARAAVDAARAARTHDTRAAILIEAVQRGVTTLDDLSEWMHRLRPRDAAPLRAPMAEAASGAWSVPECELLDLVGRSTELPEAWPNPRLTTGTGATLTTPDAWFDDVAMAVMVHSKRFHADGDDWDDTVDRDGDLVAAGVVVVGVTPHRVRRQPDAVLRRLEDTYRMAQRRPRPQVRATPRHLLVHENSRS